jgi:hypothetical protein
MKIFLSYPRKDTAKAHQLQDALVAGGHTVWRDDQLITGQPWRSQLEAEIKAADAIALALTPNWVASPYCNWEFITAAEAGKHIIPVMLVKAELPDTLRPYQYANLTDFTDAAVNKLLADLMRLAQPATPPNLDKSAYAAQIDAEHGGTTVSGTGNVVADCDIDKSQQTFNIGGNITAANLNMGGTQTFHGDVNIQYGALSAAPTGSPLDELKSQLVELESALKTETASPETVELVQEYANAIAEEASKPQPRKAKLTISGEGLQKAAQNLLKVSPIVAKIAQTLLKIG